MHKERGDFLNKKDVFSMIQEYETVKAGKHKFLLPITFHHADVFTAAFTISTRKLLKLLPTKQFTPMQTLPGRAVMMVSAMDYSESNLGAHGEASIAFPVMLNTISIPILSALFELRWPGSGLYVYYLTVTTETVCAARKEIWKYPCSVAEMDFTDRPGIHRVEVKEDGEKVFTFTVRKTGKRQVDTTDWRTYSIKGDEILDTTIYIYGKRRVARLAHTAELELGSHPVCDVIRELEPSAAPVMSSYYLSINAVLPRPQKTSPLKEDHTKDDVKSGSER